MMKKISEMTTSELRDAKSRYGTLVGGMIYSFYLFLGVGSVTAALVYPDIGFPVIGIGIVGWIIFVVYKKIAIDNELKRR